MAKKARKSKKDDKERYIFCHVQPIEDTGRIYVLIPSQLWKTQGLSKVVKDSIDHIFSEKEERLQ